MTILHIITRLILGGAQQNTVLSCAAQVKAGHDVHLAFGPIYGPEGSLRDEAKASGATLHEVASMRRAVLPVHDIICYRELRKLIRETKPDVVHTHSSKAGIVGRAAAWAENVPAVIHTVHGLPFHDRQARWVYQLYVALERFAAKRCHHLIAITPAMVETFAKENIASTERFTVIPSGIDLSRFMPCPQKRDAVRDAFGISKNAQVVGLVARLDALKGHGDLLEVLPKLREGGRDVQLLFVGDGFVREQIEAQASTLTGVTFTGRVELARIPELLAAMDVMVLPSYQEGQSRTLIEALLCGVPIAAYDTGGIGAVCVENQTGRLVPRGDRDALAQAIRDMLNDPQAAQQLVAQGQQHVREHYSAERMNEQIEDLYEQLLSGKK